MPEVINMGYSEVQQAFFADKAAMMLHGSWLSSGMYNLAPHLKGKVGLAPNPVYPRPATVGPTPVGGVSPSPHRTKPKSSLRRPAGDILGGEILEDVQGRAAAGRRSADAEIHGG